MPGMDLEILSGLAALSDDGGGGDGGMADMMGMMMGAMMGNAPEAFNYLAGGEDDGQQQMLNTIAGYNPQLAMMMGWNPLSAGWKGMKALGRGARKVGGALMPSALQSLLPAILAKQFAQQARSPMAQQTPLSAVQPNLPGVADRGGRVQPLGFENGAFTAAGPAVVTVRARPQRPVRGGRLVGDFARSGATATGLLTLVQLVVATDGQLLSGDPISFAALSPNAFGVGVNLTPAAVGNEIFATVAISALPTGADRVDFNMTLFGLTIG